MRRFLLFLALVAWVVSCFDAVSYFRARDNERMSQSNATKASDALIARENSTATNNDIVRQKIEKDQIAVQTDEQMLASAQKRHKDSFREEQLLATDRARLDADRIVDYSSQDYARANPDPQVAATRESLDIYRQSVAVSQATEARDITLTRGLVGLWFVILVLGFFTAKARPGASIRPGDQAVI